MTTEPPRPDPFLIADDAALDLLNSVCAPTGETIDWLVDGAGLIDWMRAAGLIDADSAERLSSLPKARLDAAAAAARAFRERLRRLVEANAGTSALAINDDDIAWIDALLARDSLRLRLEPAGDKATASFQLRRERRFDDADDLAAPLAERAARLIAEGDFGAVKQCEGPSCTLWFRDLSKNRTRRWCDMNLCGNRAKAAAFRERRKSRK